MFLVPTMLRRLVTLPEELFAKHPISSVRGIVSGAAELPHALREMAIRRFGKHAVYDFYGATELGWVTVIDGEEMLRKPSSVGRPLAGQEIRILDEKGNVKPAGEIGLIYVRNEQTMLGYLKDHASTEQSRRGDWMTVEDLGYLDVDGYLFLAGRERDVVKSGGVSIYPVEIEEALSQHPSVQEVSVIGVPDAEWGERLVAVVVPAKKGQFSVQEVEQFARQRLAGLKVPRRWELVDELPRNQTGKVMKTELRARFSPA